MGKEAKQIEWTFAAFGISKKNGENRLVIDFRKINEMLECKEFPVPTMEKTLQIIGSFRYATIIDSNMGCMVLNLNTKAKRILHIAIWVVSVPCSTPRH